MNFIQWLLLTLLLSLSSNGLTAEKSTVSYSLSVARVFEPHSAAAEWVFILGGTGPRRGGETVCKSVTSLKKLLSGLPRGSTLDWFPTCSREFDVLRGDLDELKAICTKAGVHLTIHPAG